MSEPQRKFDPSSGSNILTFPSGAKSSEGSGAFPSHLLTELLGKDVLENKLKETIENAVLEAYLKTRMADLHSNDNPFGPIYISLLEPDNITAVDAQNLTRLFAIEDLSDTITFKDDWED